MQVRKFAQMKAQNDLLLNKITDQQLFVKDVKKKISKSNWINFSNQKFCNLQPRMSSQTEASMSKPKMNARGGVVRSKIHSLETSKNINLVKANNTAGERTKVWT